MADPGLVRGPRVALICAHDNAAEIGATVSALVPFLSGEAKTKLDRILVVDDGSSDSTSTEARAAGADVLRLDQNVGKGGAMAAGLAASPAAGVYLLVDADVGATAARAPELLEPVLAGRADMAVGVLPGAGRRGGFGLVRRLAGGLVRRACGHEPRAPLSGQRALRAEVIRGLELAEGFGVDAALTADAVLAGARVVEVPVEMGHRERGRGPAGFAHRGRQGIHLLRAMWPRTTTTVQRRILVVAVTVLAMAGALVSGTLWEPDSVAGPPGVERVVILAAPGLGWDELGSGEWPNLDSMVEQGAVAAMTVRTLSRHPDPAESYATLGAGTRVRVRLPVAVEATDGGGAVVTEVDRLRGDAGPNVSSLPGALGQALAEAGISTGLVATTDVAPGLVGLGGASVSSEAAALAVMDGKGRVDQASLDPRAILAEEDPAAFGTSVDPPALASATLDALETARVVIVDPGDLTRVAALDSLGAPGWFTRLRRSQVMSDLDATVGILRRDLPATTMLMVMAPTPPEDEWRLTPVLATGAGVAPGYFHSPSTRRLGLVTLTDLAPSILDHLGVAVPSGMIGSPLRLHPGVVELDRLRRLDSDVAYRERVYLPVAQSAVWVQGVGYLAVVALLGGAGASRLGPRGRARVRAALGDVLLAFAAFPLATLAFRLTYGLARPLGLSGLFLLVGLDLVIVVVARRSGSPSRPLAPLSWILGITTAVLVADIATGARLQTGSILGYSPQSAGRFYGIGNAAFAVLAASTILACALHVHHSRRRSEAVLTAACVLALVVLVDGGPGLGDDVGGILTLVPVGVAMIYSLAGRRLTLRVVLAAAALGLVVLGTAAAVDSLAGPADRSHLGRLSVETLRNGPGELTETLARKVRVNTTLIRTTPWAWLVPVIAGFLIAGARGLGRGSVPTLPRPVRIGTVAALAAGLVGFAVNDSGVVVIALVLSLVAPVLGRAALTSDPDLASDSHFPPRRLLMATRGPT